jgi:hypothetical protein
MRIGEPDLDAVYDRLIRPAIQAVGLSPRRIDRVMHNERIDQRILAELNAADVVVADLTFARPSVYWEAGFAEREVPVVYTCRRDHFRPRLGDDFGNFKVHFDLQTKNIIGWTSPTDAQFRRALDRRLRYVLRPILRVRGEAQSRQREESAFAALAMTERRQRVVDIAVSQGRALGLRGVQSGVDLKDFLTAPVWAAVAEHGSMFSYDGPRVALTVWVVAVPKLPKAALRVVRDEGARGLIDRDRAVAAAVARKTIVDHAVVVSFSPVSPVMVGETLPSFKRDSNTSWPAWSEEIESQSVTASTGRPLRRTVRVHILDNVRSERQAREQIKQLLSSIAPPRRP